MPDIPATKTVLTGPDKAALLLSSLGPDLSAHVLKLCREDMVERIISRMVGMHKVTADIALEVIEEGVQQAKSEALVEGGGMEKAREILVRALGVEPADDLLRRLYGGARHVPFDFMRDVDSHQLTDYLQSEHPQTAALVLSKISPQIAADVLSRFPRELQVQIVARIANMEPTSPDVVNEVEGVMRARLSGAIRRDYAASGGVDFLVQLLTHVNREIERNILAQLEAVAPEICEEVKSKMFLFEDIVTLEDRAIQRILRDVDMKVLTKAMRGASDEVKGTIFRNMSVRAADALREDIEALGPVHMDQVSKAQQAVVAVIRRLEEKEEIIIARGGENVYL